jgi:hypothetical protein
VNGCSPKEVELHPPGHVGTFWHLFDLLLIRPDLLHFFRSETLCILTDVPLRGQTAAEHLDALRKLP